jgi:hypothetical protein
LLKKTKLIEKLFEFAAAAEIVRSFFICSKLKYYLYFYSDSKANHDTLLSYFI